MDKEIYASPKVESTDVEIGVYGQYDCDGDLVYNPATGKCDFPDF